MRARAGRAQRRRRRSARARRRPLTAPLVATSLRRYGWRAYALPVLVVVTVAALLTTNQVRHAPRRRRSAPAARQQRPGAQRAAAASGSIALKNDTGRPERATTPCSRRPLSRPAARTR